MKIVDKAFKNKLKKSVLKIESVFRKSGLSAEIFEINLGRKFVGFAAKISESINSSKKKVLVNKIASALELTNDEIKIEGIRSKDKSINVRVASKSFN
jgi:hypothetical protein